jgi:SAM-dependent methyltransferase
MWQDAAFWLPQLLEGKKILAHFTFGGDNETVMAHEIKEEKDFLWPHLKSLPYFRSVLRSVEASYYQDFDFPEPILDVGSGDGHFASTAYDFEVNIGLDPSWELLSESKRYKTYKSLVQANGAEMPFPDSHFACALSNSVLEHIPNVEEVLKETARVLKPGAPFVFCCPNPGYLTELSIPSLLGKIGLNRLGQAYEDWFGRITRTIHTDPPEVWGERLENAGFVLERWWHYFSSSSLRMMEWGHYFGAPCLLAKKLFGRWIIAPTHWNLWLTERLVRPYANNDPLPNGTYTFYVTRKL